MKIPDDEWQEFGGDFTKSFDEGLSSSAMSMESEESVFELYFKGLVNEEQVGIKKFDLAGILPNCMMKALIKGLTAALS
ncbi:hypothetical protein M0R45_036538 [Rubus argutus]|uniref:Uncharacterized protein n=1 Tax=Rubus argutus TaxID=59490 RepID=A0AAW1VWH0_RUBAR